MDWLDENKLAETHCKDAITMYRKAISEYPLYAHLTKGNMDELSKTSDIDIVSILSQIPSNTLLTSFTLLQLKQSDNFLLNGKFHAKFY